MDTLQNCDKDVRLFEFEPKNLIEIKAIVKCNQIIIEYIQILIEHNRISSNIIKY